MFSNGCRMVAWCGCMGDKDKRWCGLVLIKYERYWCGWCDIPNIPRLPSLQIKENLNIEGSICNRQKVFLPIITVPPPDQPRHRGDHQAAAVPQPRPSRQQGGQGQAQGTIVTIVLLSDDLQLSYNKHH